MAICELKVNERRENGSLESVPQLLEGLNSSGGIPFSPTLPLKDQEIRKLFVKGMASHRQAGLGLQPGYRNSWESQLWSPEELETTQLNGVWLP